MATSTYLRLDGIRGEATLAPFAGWIPLESYSLGDGQAVRAGSAAPRAGGGARLLTDLHCTARMGAHSAPLMQMAMSGKMTNGELVQLDGRDPILTIALRSALVASFQPANAGGDLPMNSFSINTGQPFQPVYHPKPAPATAGSNSPVGRWAVTIGKWSGFFVFDAGGGVHWTDRSSAKRTPGKWKATKADVQWKFSAPGDIRTFVISLPIAAGTVSGKILPAGQGVFSMKRA